MGKKKKNTEVKVNKTSKPRESNDIICDTSADRDDILDLSVQGQTIEGLLNLEKTYTTRDNITVSWRIPKDLLEHAKTIAMQESLAKGKDVHYQKLILGAFLEKYPLDKE